MSKEPIEQALEEHGEAIKEFSGEVKSGLGNLGNRIDKLEAKLNRGGEYGRPENKSFASAFCEHPEAKAIMSGERKLGRGQSVRFTIPNLEMKAVLGVSTGSPNTDWAIHPDQHPNIQGFRGRPLRILDLLPQITVKSNAFDWPKFTSFTDNAGYQAQEGVTKGASDAEAQMQTTSIPTIAHYIKVSEQALADQAVLQPFLDMLMRHYLARKLDTELLTGNGTGRNINGLVTQAVAFSSSETSVADKISAQLNEIETLDYEPGVIVMHPTRWHAIRTGKASGSGEYLSGSFSSPAPRVLWDVPVVTTRAMDSTKVLCADLRNGAAYLNRQDVEVEIGRDGNDFTQNLLTIRAELRGALAVWNTSSLNVQTVA